MDSYSEPVSPISLSETPNPLPFPPPRTLIAAASPNSQEWEFDPSEASIPTPITTHYSPIPTYSWENTAYMYATVVPETPMDEDLLPETPVTVSREFDCVSTVVPETPMVEALLPETSVTALPEFDCMSTFVPQTPLVRRARKRPIEEEEWFKEMLVILLPGMADLL